jgi:hypothetical protein
VFKYFPHPNDDGTVKDSGEDNDYVFLRYADVLLMKAEAIMRGGTDPNGQTALQIVNAIRTPRGATAISAVTEQLCLQNEAVSYTGKAGEEMT